MKKWLCAVLISLTVFIVYCDDFVKKENEAAVRDLENTTFVMKEKITVNEEILAKGQKVRIKVSWGKDWVRVRAYPADMDPLQARQLLILYLFEDKFEKEKFSMDRFVNKLHEVAVPAGNK